MTEEEGAAASSSNDGGPSLGRFRAPRTVEAIVRREERAALLPLLPAGLGGCGAAAAEAATVAEYALRCGGGGKQQHRAHVVAAPCFLRVSSAVAYPF